MQHFDIDPGGRRRDRTLPRGRKDEAAQAIPVELVDDVATIGDQDHVCEQIAIWEAAGVTTMVITAQSPAQIRDIAALAT